MRIQTRYLGLLTRSQPLPLHSTVASEDTVDRKGLPIWRRREATVISPTSVEVKQFPPLDADLSVGPIRYRLEGEEIRNARLVLSRFLGFSKVLVSDSTLPRGARK